METEKKPIKTETISAETIKDEGNALFKSIFLNKRNL